MSIEKIEFKLDSHESADLHKDRFVFTFFRDLPTSQMRVYHREIKRGRLYRIATYPERQVDYQAYIEVGGAAKFKERLIAAQWQVETLYQAFGAEGLTVLELTDEQAAELDSALRQLNFENLNAPQAKAVLHQIPTFARERIAEAVNKAVEYANSVLATTKQELAKARAGKMGKAFLDSRDSQACFILDIPESNITSAEAEARNSAIQQIIGISPAAADSAATKLVESMRKEIEELKQTIEILEVRSRMSRRPVGRPRKQKLTYTPREETLERAKGNKFEIIEDAATADMG